MDPDPQSKVLKITFKMQFFLFPGDDFGLLEMLII